MTLFAIIAGVLLIFALANWHVYDQVGFDRDGYDRKGFNRDGYNRDGYNRRGRDRRGYTRAENEDFD